MRFWLTDTWLQAGNNRGRGAIIKASNGVIANNRFVGVAYAGLDIGPEFTYWVSPPLLYPNLFTKIQANLPP